MRYGVSGDVRVSEPSAGIDADNGEEDDGDEGTNVVQPCRFMLAGLPVTV